MFNMNIQAVDLYQKSWLGHWVVFFGKALFEDGVFFRLTTLSSIYVQPPAANT